MCYDSGKEFRVGHNCCLVLNILCAWVLLIFKITFTSLASKGQAVIFQNTTSVTNEIYQTEITPAEFTYYVWIVIFVCQVIFLCYAFATILRPSGPGYLYTTPRYLPPSVYIAYSVSLLFCIVVIFLWDNGEIEAALAFRIFAVIGAYVALGISMYGLFTNQKLLVSFGHPHEYKWVIALVWNSLAAFAMWIMIEALVNLSAVLVYSIDVHQNASGSISLAVLTALVVCYSLVDLAFFERYFRYLYAPWLILIWAFVGILDGNLDWSTSNTVFTLGLIIITTIVLFVKVALSVSRSCRKPIFHQSDILGNGSLTVVNYGTPPPVTSVPVVAACPPAAFTGYPSLT